MKRYRIVYSKQGYPMTAWKDSIDEARELAERLRKTGYTVDVWEYTETAAREIQF